MKLKRKALSILLTLSLLVAMLVPVTTAFAATDNYAVTIPKVQNDTDNVTLGVLAIEEDSSTFRVNDLITINLPSGVEYSTEPTALTVDDYVYSADGVEVDYVTSTDSSLTVVVTNAGAGTEDVLYFYFGEDEDGADLASTVDIDSDVTGDIKVEIEADGTTVSSEFVTVARIVEGDTTTTISDVEAIAIDGTDEIGTIKIKENAPGVIDTAGEDIKLVLPNDFEWVIVAGTTKFTGTNGITVTGSVDSDDPETLLLNVGGTNTSGQAGFISISGLQIYVPDDADEGDVEMTVKGNEVTEEDIVVATVGDFGFEVDVDGDVPTIVAGKSDEEVADFFIDDVVPGTWIDGRTVKIELPSWAEWNDIDVDVDELDNGTIDSDDPEILKYTATGSDGKAEFEKFTINVDADAPEGDLVAKFYGSAGVEDEIVIAKIIKPFTVTADKPEVMIGVQDQKVGDITIVETEDEAVDEDKWIILEAPVGFTFNDDYDIEVTDGDMEVDNDDVDGRYLAFQVTGESAKKASTIKITDITFDVDRTIPVGDITFDVYMTTNDAMDDEDFDGTFDEAIDNDNYEDVTDVVVGTVMNPAPGGTVANAVFVIGQTTYNLNGVEMTMDAAPYIKGDRTFLPVRFVCNALGVADNNIIWNAEEQSVLIIKGDRIVKLTIGSKMMNINGVPFMMDVAPEIVDPGRTMLPLRAIAEAFGADVQWDAATQTVTVISI